MRPRGCKTRQHHQKTSGGRSTPTTPPKFLRSRTGKKTKTRHWLRLDQFYAIILETMPGNLSADTSGSLLTLARTSFATSCRYDACSKHASTKVGRTTGGRLEKGVGKRQRPSLAPVNNNLRLHSWRAQGPVRLTEKQICAKNAQRWNEGSGYFPANKLGRERAFPAFVCTNLHAFFSLALYLYR